MLNYGYLNKLWRERGGRKKKDWCRLQYAYHRVYYDRDGDFFYIKYNNGHPMLRMHRDNSLEVFFADTMLTGWLDIGNNNLLQYFTGQRLCRPKNKRLHFLWFGSKRIYGNFRIWPTGRIQQQGRPKMWVDVPDRIQQLERYLHKLYVATLVFGECDDMTRYYQPWRVMKTILDGRLNVTKEKRDLYARYLQNNEQISLKSLSNAMKKQSGLWKLKTLKLSQISSY